MKEDFFPLLEEKVESIDPFNDFIFTFVLAGCTISFSENLYIQKKSEYCSCSIYIVQDFRYGPPCLS